MKNTFLILFLAISFQAVSQKGSVRNDSTIIHNLIQAEFDAVWSEYDTTGLSKFHTEDFLLLEHGEVWNNDTIKTYQKRGVLRKDRPVRTNRFEVLEARSSKDIIYASYHNFATMTKDGEVVGKYQWLESVVAIKTKGGWRLKQMHSTRVKIN
ncbi:MAG: hypothetical protein ACI81T_002924 [Bacteroidia bacterium]|jgi:hypothetical protein